jgi:hypothetical protein
MSRPSTYFGPTTGLSRRRSHVWFAKTGDCGRHISQTVLAQDMGSRSHLVAKSDGGDAVI